VTEHSNEFSFLSGQAQLLDAEVPSVYRTEANLADGRKLSGLRFGDSPPKITLVHGAGLNAHTWDNTVLALGEPVLALDLPGHGDSDWRADGDYRAQTLAPDVATAISALTDSPQLLVGHSLGGLTATMLAAKHPELIRGLVLVDIAPGIDLNAGPSELREFFKIVDFDNREAMVDRAQAFGFGGNRADTERGVFHNSRIREDGRAEWKHHFAHLASAALGTGVEAATSPLSRDEELWQALESITAPILLIRGTRGYVTEDAAAEFTRRLPHARRIDVDAGHNVQENDPVTLARLIAAELAL
jgi:pimeloyl-ACP methyl ester carboxylesterase